MKYGSDNSKPSKRKVILETIKQSNEATVEYLAKAADVSPVTVRHHLNSLQADGLLEIRSVRRKVGRPYYVYSLSDQGNELFPKRYMQLSSRLLDELKEHFPEGTVDALFSNVVNQIAEDHRKEFEGMTTERRLDFLVELLGEEGFLAAWEKSGEKYVLSEYSCPYYSVGQKHDEVCTFDKQLVQIVLETEIEHESCMLHGDSCCQFSFDAAV
ncbi:MAG: helix-turn-helix transcriptional regulator, partial [Candidatus Promineifilaceae bacterium]